MTYSRRFWTCFNWFFVVDFHTPFLCGLTDGFIGVGNINQTTLLLKLTSAFCHHSSPMVIEEFIPIEKWIYIYMVTPPPTSISVYIHILHMYIHKIDTQGGGGKDLQILGPCGYLWYPHETPTTCRFQRFKVLSGNGNSYGYMDLGRCAKPLATEGTVYWGSFSFSREDGVRTRVIFLACLRTSTRSFVLEK